MQFDQFSGQSFEQLIQALATHLFGPGITIFGPGRDGGREATFRGALPTFEAKGWDGYTVLQAKCKERPFGDSRDASWLCTQLRGELQKFVDNGELERPEYYLLCTNVQLSAVPGVGGKQQIEDVFEDFRSVLNLKGWHVWSADELRSLLAAVPQIRQTFASWITPGDVLFELMEQLVGPDLKRAIPLILSRELRADRDARLRDAGQETDQAVYLEKVFIDLPVDLPVEFSFLDGEAITFLTEHVPNGGDDREEAIGADDDDEDEELVEISFDDLADNCVASLFALAADRLDPKSIDSSRRSKRWALRNRVVILGGPGQGKSTLGQFVVQLARARLLAASERLTLNPETSRAIEQIHAAAQSLNIPLHGPARIPVRIDLPMFADAVSKGSDAGHSILNFAAKRFGEISGYAVTVPAMRKLLEEFPWIVIFDGLDEVPPSSNRQDVIKAIETFWDDVYSVGGDVLSVVTSRPQGYDNDLSPELWQHWNLLPLTPKYAIEYATKLGDVRVSEPERREAILSDIGNACSDPATSLLTTSPLQVTILFGISFLKGSIPQDRWELFDRYYNLMREREAQKPGSTAKFIRDNKRTIDDLHQTCGWILQAEAEARGRTVSYLTDEQFKRIIGQLLKDEGHDGLAATELTDRLATIATDRLVMLASRTEGQVSFDVRSLQEYMAAAKLVGSDQHLLTERLRKIAASAHWRHVFRIAASKIFSITEMGHLRSDIVAICDALDKGDLDKAAPFIGAGAALALDLLADGIASNAPKFYRSLFARAIAVLDMEQDAFDSRIASVATADKGKMLLEAIETRLNGTSFLSKSNALTALLRVQNLEHAPELLDKIWGMEPELLLRLLASVDLALVPKKYGDQVKALQKRAGEVASSAFWINASTGERDNAQVLAEWALHPEILRSPFAPHSRALLVRLTENTSTTISPLEMQSEFYRKLDEDLDVRAWPVVNAAKIFTQDPSPATLASYVTSVTALPLNWLGEMRYDVPWPLKAINNDIREGADGAQLAKAAEEGALGNFDTWLAAERRWRSKPVDAVDFLSWNKGLYLSCDIDAAGPPPITRISTKSNGAADGIGQLLDVASELKVGPKRETLLWLIISSLRNDRALIEQGYAQKILEVYFEGEAPLVPLSAKRARIFSLGASVWSDERVAELAHRYGLEGQRVHARLVDLLAAFNANPQLRGLLAHVRTPVNPASRPHTGVNPSEEALVTRDGDPVGVRAGVTLLRLRFNELEGIDMERASADLIACGSSFEAARLLKAREPGDKVRQDFAFQLAKQLRVAGREPAGALLDLLNANVSAAPTALGSNEVAQALGLPCLVLS
ncbi:NACHT domain-containing NTPase [Rhizobium leguminosarum]|uniref:NACHT domain-containing protein n=1 Tax=Rhizobium leguminosarum TaxID=384 RepID=UPI003F944F2D